MIMRSKFSETVIYLHSLDRYERIELLQHFDLTQRQREVLEMHEFDRTHTIAELSEMFCVCEREILHIKQNALATINKGLLRFGVVIKESNI